MPTLVILVAIAVVVAALGSLTGAQVALGADPAGARASAAELDPDRVERPAA